jgi:hypothetical protein
MEIEQLKKKIKKIKKAKIRFDEKFRRNYKNELQKFDDEIYSINLLIQSKLKNNKIIYSSKPPIKSKNKGSQTIPQNRKARKDKGFVNINLKQIANVEGGLQIIQKSKLKPKPINRQAARAVGIYSKKNR